MFGIGITYVKKHPPLCDEGARVFLLHIRTCEPCKVRMSEFIRGIRKEIPAVKLILSTEKIEEIITFINTWKGSEETHG